MTKFDRISYFVADLIGEKPIVALGMFVLGLLIAGGWEIN